MKKRGINAPEQMGIYMSDAIHGGFIKHRSQRIVGVIRKS